jgi:hypothetical protein
MKLNGALAAAQKKARTEAATLKAEYAAIIGGLQQQLEALLVKQQSVPYDTPRLFACVLFLVHCCLAGLVRCCLSLAYRLAALLSALA